MGPVLASLSSKIYQNKKLFKRIETLYNSPDKGKLTKEQQRLIWLNYTNFVKEGANLNPEAKEKVAKINGELASYFSTFSQNLLAEENNEYVALNNQGDFDGLFGRLEESSDGSGKERNLNVLGVIGNTRSFVEPFLTFSNDRELRAKVWSMYVKRGDNENELTIKPPCTDFAVKGKKSKITWFPYFRTLEPEQ
jgi:peptidyl-dipeptidase Dcp